MDSQLRADWPRLLDQIAGALNPIHDEIFQRFPMHYYWATYQSEWATDIVFQAAEDLRRLYPSLVHHAMTTFSSPDVLRFLGKQFTAAGHINGHVKAEVTSDLKRRQEGYGSNIAMAITRSSCTTKPTRLWEACCAPNLRCNARKNFRSTVASKEAQKGR